MPASRPGMPDPAVLRNWFVELQKSDPLVHAQIAAALPAPADESVTLESLDAAPPEMDFIALETIVLSEGRPVLPIRNNRISDAHKVEVDSREIVQRLVAKAGVVEPWIPLVGRIDVANHAGGLEFVGTGWLIEENLVVTNRHVAELIARWDGAKYTFRPGRFGDPLEVSIDYLREPDGNATASAPVESVVWIVPEANGPDLALLQVGRRTDGTFPKKIDLAASDASEGDDVVVIGYPARAPAHIIRDQVLMDRIYGGVYDVKRIAPGKMKRDSRGWATHDCTTLGGNSGSVVLDMKSGKAVALHFAGLYMIENYCVPASKVRHYLDPANRKPIEIRRNEEPAKAQPGPQPVPSSPAPSTGGGEITITLPLTIKVSLGSPAAPGRATPAAGGVEAAARALSREAQGDGVYAVRPGYVVAGGRLTDQPCVVVKAEPSRIDEVRARVPAAYGAFPVEVRPASVLEMTGEEEVAEEAAIAIQYNDDDRTGPGFSFNWVEEEMTVRLSVGPEQSWPVLSDFLKNTKNELVSSIYEFHAQHIAEALEAQLEKGRKLTLVMAPQTKGLAKKDGEFDRLETFEQWAADHPQFDRIFVPIGTGGLVARSYHIKVTVKDEESVWLSSGNWKGPSQPVIAPADASNPKKMKGNREWHVVLDDATLAERFRNHILEDRRRSEVLGGTPETMAEEVLVDVPVSLLEGIELEGAPSRLLPPLEFTRKVRVKPLLTPDDEGAVYSRAVLRLIRSAKEELLFQNQYISVTSESSGFFSDLVDALVERSNEIDVKVILRSSGSEFLDQVSELKRRGMDVNSCVRRMANTHTKGIIVDGKKVLVGSHNWSSLGVTLNRDASLIFDDVEAAQYFREAFFIDWDRASELSIDTESVFGEAPIPASGAAPPPGYVRMSLSSYLEG
jgi:V8-like Glu-specific endopeptidase